MTRELRTAVASALAPKVLAMLRDVKRETQILGTTRWRRECPICGNRLRFLVVNSKGGRRETLCMGCNSLERHRRAVLFIRLRTNLHSEKRRRLKVLHVAPEASLRGELLRLKNIDYVTGDLYATDVDLRLDLTAIEFPDHSFDVILCSHVLEHIPDDLRAMREIRRVLRPDGWALINVPSDPERAVTYEDAQIVEPQDRLAHFGQEDHVRVYSSRGVVERLRAAGFDVVVDPIDFDQTERRRYLLDGDAGWDHAYLCRPSADAD